MMYPLGSKSMFKLGGKQAGKKVQGIILLLSSLVQQSIPSPLIRLKSLSVSCILVNMPRFPSLSLFKRSSSNSNHQHYEAAIPSPCTDHYQHQHHQHQQHRAKDDIGIIDHNINDIFCLTTTNSNYPYSNGGIDQHQQPASIHNSRDHNSSSGKEAFYASQSTISTSSFSVTSTDNDNDCKAGSPTIGSPKSSSRRRRLLHKASCGLLRLSIEAASSSVSICSSNEESSLETAQSQPHKASRQLRFYTLPIKRFRFTALKRSDSTTSSKLPRKSKSLNNLNDDGHDDDHACSTIEATKKVNGPDTDHYRWSRLRENVFLYDPALMPSSQSSSDDLDDTDLFHHEFIPNTSSSPYIIY
ncbi:hypothetical protein BDF22DRAFT_682776 [Syncephalis plumigaleata]|nr:hypothetical protein BDF22DRAFT_682776 [Syncephalis plumigaleata]